MADKEIVGKKIFLAEHSEHYGCVELTVRISPVKYYVGSEEVDTYHPPYNIFYKDMLPIVITWNKFIVENPGSDNVKYTEWHYPKFRIELSGSHTLDQWKTTLAFAENMAENSNVQYGSPVDVLLFLESRHFVEVGSDSRFDRLIALSEWNDPELKRYGALYHNSSSSWDIAFLASTEKEAIKKIKMELIDRDCEESETRLTTWIADGCPLTIVGNACPKPVALRDFLLGIATDNEKLRFEQKAEEECASLH